MKIVNPLYDHAFKYLMSNDRLARKVLSVILEKEVLELELSQQEVVATDQQRRFTLYRLDFKAVIRDENGQKERVLIELQKSKLPTNVLRFRNYLGMSYAQKAKSTGPARVEEEPLPIISIYILGYNVEDIPVMAVKVDRHITDLSRHEKLYIKSDFIELLTHTCYILQVRRLPEQRRSRIEQFMTLFNQAWVAEKNYVLDLEEVPEDFKDIAQFLAHPLHDEEMQRRLEAEEELETVFARQEAEREKLIQMVEEERRMKEEETRLKEEERRMKEEERRMKEEERRMKEEERRMKEEERRMKEKEREHKEIALSLARENAIKLARFLLQSGASAEEVSRETGLSEEELRSLGGG